jgi:hypothetical protein
MAIRKTNHSYHIHLVPPNGASFLGFIMWTLSFSYFTVLKYVKIIFMNQMMTYLLRCLRLFLRLVGYCGHLNLKLSSQTFQQKVKTLEHPCNSSNHSPIWYMSNTTQGIPLSPLP